MSEPRPDPFAAVTEAAARLGGFVIDLPWHVVAWLPRGHGRMAVSFDNLASVREARRMPWGDGFLAARGWDVLGVMIKQKDWFRHPALLDALEGLRDEGFFARPRAVSMYGSSMGGFGAATFAGLAPGCTVLAFAPQSSLAKSLAPFETRYKYGRSLGDWTGRYRDGAEGIRAAGRAYLAYDPALPPDAAHVARLAGPNVTPLPMPHLGHKLPPALNRMGILKPLSETALAGTLEPAEFHRLYRARRASVPWLVSLFKRAGRSGHAGLALRQIARLPPDQAQHWKLKQLRRALETDAPTAFAEAAEDEE